MLVPVDFVVPLRLETPQFRLDPLGPEHNDADYRAWSSSMEHIQASPGWKESSWPRDMTLEENRADLQRHADDFQNRSGFTYTVLEPGGDVVGCVYIYPPQDERHDVQVESWVRASRADLDEPLWRAVSDWLAAEWPFERSITRSGKVRDRRSTWTNGHLSQETLSRGQTPRRVTTGHVWGQLTQPCRHARALSHVSNGKGLTPAF